MAYDKVVDSAVLDAGLTATANAIREKTGDSAVIQWMNENGFKAAVDAIEASGATATWGFMTPASADLITIKHGLGKRPIIWGYILNFFPYKQATDSNETGIIAYIRDGISSGDLKTNTADISQFAYNKSMWSQPWGERTMKKLDTEDAASIAPSNFYGAMWPNKNYFKIQPLDGYERGRCSVGRTYLWFIAGID